MILKKVYFAASFASRDVIEARASEFEDLLGIEVTSNWLQEPKVPVDEPNIEEWILRARANEDRVDVERSDAVVVFTDVPSTTGGRHVELGMALALRKPVFLIGPRENVFHYPSDVKQYDTWDDFLMEEFNVGR